MVVAVFHLAGADDYPDVVRVVALIEDFDPDQDHPVDDPVFAGVVDGVDHVHLAPVAAGDHLALDHPEKDDLLLRNDHLVQWDPHLACRPGLKVHAARGVANYRL